MPLVNYAFSLAEISNLFRVNLYVTEMLHGRNVPNRTLCKVCVLFNLSKRSKVTIAVGQSFTIHACRIQCDNGKIYKYLFSVTKLYLTQSVHTFFWGK